MNLSKLESGLMTSVRTVRLLEAEVVTEPVGREPVEHPAETLEPSTSASFNVEDHCLGSTLMLSSSSDTCPSSGSSESFPFLVCYQNQLS